MLSDIRSRLRLSYNIIYAIDDSPEIFEDRKPWE